ncbi:MAG: hypothetical protein IJ075_06290 [Lachnospiraceae bacterium]|nr:hypothetical protein [Lachnospiraceae bacterium]
MNKKAKKIYTLIQGLAIIDVLLLILCAILAFKAIDYQKENARLAQENEKLHILSGSSQGDGAEQEAEMSETGSEAMIIEELPGDADTRAILKSYAEQGKSFISTLKAIFTDQFVIADEGKFYFMDIDPALRPYSYDSSKISLSDNGVIQYADETADISYGIDISQHNGEIDWEAFNENEEKPDFIYVRSGLRGYQSGKLVADTQVSANLIGARESGAEVGIYFVTQAVNEEEAREEARFAIETLSDNTIDLPVAIDVEKVENYENEPRTKSLTAEEYTRNVLAFADEMKQNGYDTIIYGNGKTFMLMLDITQLEDTGKWFADYVAEDDYIPYFPYDFSIWQFSSRGRMKGITGDVDLNIRFNSGSP